MLRHFIRSLILYTIPKSQEYHNIFESVSTGDYDVMSVLSNGGYDSKGVLSWY